MFTLIKGDDRVHLALPRLARKMGLEVADTIGLADMQAVLQSHWLQRGKMRHELEGDPPDSEDIVLLWELGCIDEIKAPRGVMDMPSGALLLGGFLPRVRTRLAFLESEHQRGVYFRDVYLLGGERSLDTTKESADDLRFPKIGLPLEKSWDRSKVPLPKTEIEMMQYVVQQCQIPDNWNVHTVRTPQIANTLITLLAWQAKTTFVAGAFLIVSNQPFVHYQETLARGYLSSEMQFFGIGESADPSLPLVLFLDNLAKQFNEEFSLYKKLRREK